MKGMGMDGKKGRRGVCHGHTSAVFNKRSRSSNVCFYSYVDTPYNLMSHIHTHLLRFNLISIQSLNSNSLSLCGTNKTAWTATSGSLGQTTTLIWMASPSETIRLPKFGTTVDNLRMSEYNLELKTNVLNPSNGTFSDNLQTDCHSTRHIFFSSKSWHFQSTTHSFSRTIISSLNIFWTITMARLLITC